MAATTTTATATTASTTSAEQHQKENNTQLASQDVGLIFVREYYTFLNKKPNRLHAFYNKDSTLVRGDEGTVTATMKGQEVRCLYVCLYIYIYGCLKTQAHIV